jgi:DNA-directed RNA polymerase subunit RPC12/RpoP
MKRIVIKGYICPLCGEGVRLIRPSSLVRCSCGALALYGQPENPTVGCAVDCELETVSTIAIAPDDYDPAPATGGKLVLDKRAGKIYGMPNEFIELTMPLLAFAKEAKWTERRLLEACHALIRYDKLLGKSLDTI